MAEQTFPGVYTRIVDQSFLPAQQSRFRPALVGIASKGPMGIPTQVTSLKDFLIKFGNPVEDYTDPNNRDVSYYMADAVALVADFTSDMTVVRVGNQYTAAPTVTGTASSTTLVLTAGTQFVSDLYAAAPAGELYLKLSQSGKLSTFNAKVTNITGGVVTLDSAVTETYSAGQVAYSKTPLAANSAEGLLKVHNFNGSIAVGAITGSKNSYELHFASATSGGLLNTNTVYSVVSAATGVKSTQEVQIRLVANGTAYLKSTDDAQTGYQAVPLQDTYEVADNAYIVAGTSTSSAYFLSAKTPGEWANGTASSEGLYVRVRPGSSPSTKKVEVFQNGALVEVFDNIQAGVNSDTGDTYFEEALAASEYVTVDYVTNSGAVLPANTRNPWDSTYYTSAVNAGDLTSTSTYETGGQFSGGNNGNNASETDIIGSYDPITDTLTGLRSLEDINNVDVNVIAVPMDLSTLSTSTATAGVALLQQMADTAYIAKAIAISDVPPGLNAADAVDWHNGTGVYTGRARIDKTNLAIFWNWWDMTNVFTRQTKTMPPSLAALRCLGFTFQREQPWYAAAGETRGWVPEALAVEYDKVSQDARNAMYGNGNSVNPVLKIRGRYYIYGERTLQRTESKLTAIHNLNLVNTVVKGLGEIGRQFVFDPNDIELLVHIRLAFTEFLDKVKNQRGMEDYELVIDERNNTADTRNRREVIVDLSVIPTDTAERIYINATVRESGAQLNSTTV